VRGLAWAGLQAVIDVPDSLDPGHLWSTPFDHCPEAQALASSFISGRAEHRQSQRGAPTQVQGEQEFGIRWDGEYEALSRLIFGLGTRFEETAAKSGLSREQVADLRGKLAPELFELLFVEAMPIQDAVDLARRPMP
jgi:hypothetical protein